MFGKPSHDALVGDGLPGRRSGGRIEHRVKNSSYLTNLLYWAGGVTAVGPGALLVLNALGIPVSWIFR